MAGASEDGETNYWPGFVDALSNLVLGLIVVVMVFTIALGYVSTKMSKSLADTEGGRPRKEEVGAREAKLIEEVAKLQAQVLETKKLLVDTEKRLDEKASSSTMRPVVVKVDSAAISEADIVFSFDPGTYELGADALAKVDMLMKGKGANPASKKFSITAVHASGAYSQEKRASYYRLIAIRNALLDRGVPPDNITTKADPKISLPGLQAQVRLNVGGH